MTDLGRVRAFFAQSAGSAAKFLARADGPRVGALSFDGWDTHANEGAMNGRLALLLGALDGAIATVKTESGEAWKETVVAIITEFGRTARVNGTEGTDHGTGTIAVLAGGALKGGRVISDWPGLADQMLYEQRDLKPTQDLRAALKGLLKPEYEEVELGTAEIRDVFRSSKIGNISGCRMLPSRPASFRAARTCVRWKVLLARWPRSLFCASYRLTKTLKR